MFPLFKYQVCTIQYLWKIIRDFNFFIYTLNFLIQSWSLLKIPTRLSFWFPDFVTSQKTTLFIHRYIMLSKLTRFYVYIWILVWKKSIKCRSDPVYHSLLIDYNNKNQMGNVVQSELLQCIVILSDILNVTYIFN